MNEELKIIISAITDSAKKNIQDVKKEVDGLGKEGGKSGKSLGKAFKAVGVAAGVAVGTIAAVGAALVALGNNTKQFREEQARLNAAFLSAGSSTEQAAESYKNLYRFLGDSGKATEAGAHLAKLTTNEKELAEWTTALQGVYATFGESLPIEGLTEAANETAKVGKVTGGLADALNWAGVSEDAFNAQLATANSESERQAMIRNTLNGLYSDAALLYEKNNADIIAQNEAQARLDATTAQLGKTVTPLITALANLSNTLLTALAPAIEVVAKALEWLINAVSRAFAWVSKFFAALGGKSAKANAITEAAASVGTVSTGLGKAATGAGALGSGLTDATKQAEKLKKVTAGFDELNILSNPNSESESAASGATGAAAGGLGSLPSGGVAIDTSGVTDALDNTSKSVDNFVNKIKSALNGIKTLFAPTITGFKEFGLKIGGAVKESLPNFQEGLEGFKQGFGNILTYLGQEFIPNFTNSWSENILPILGDVTAFGIEELGKDFEWLGGIFTDVVENVIKPSLDTFQTINNDSLESISKAWSKTGGELKENLSTAFQGMRDTLENFYNKFLKPLIDTVLKWVNQVWNESLKPLWDNLVDAVLDISNNITILWNKILKPIVDWILAKIYPVVKQVIDNILAVLRNLINSISNLFQGIIKIIKGIIAFITGVFTGDWNKAWQGIKDIASGWWQAVWGTIKGIINLIIDGVNSLVGGVYKAVKAIVDTVGKVAGAIGDLFGKDWGFSLPSQPVQIPRLAKGGIVTQSTLVNIGEAGAEAVIPLENNTQWIDTFVDKLAARMNTSSKIVLMVDEKELGWANINSINGITQQTGQLQLRLI